MIVRRLEFLVLLCIMLNLFSISAYSQESACPNIRKAQEFILSKVVVGDEADFKKEFKKKCKITGKFLQELLTRESKTNKVHRHGVIIKNAIISGSVDLKEAKVPCIVDLESCEFEKNIKLENCVFDRDLFLTYCHFSSGVSFSKMAVGKRAYFRGAIFEKDVRFDRISIGESINMESAHFKGNADFHEIKIKGDTYFQKAIFEGDSDFSRATVGGVLDFGIVGKGATFNKKIDLSGLRVGSNFALRGATICGPVKIDETCIEGDLKAQGANFLDSVSFKRVKVGGDANFDKAHFSGLVNFSGVKVGRHVSFIDNIFGGVVNFTEAEIGGRLLFEIKSAPALLFNDAHLQQLLIREPVEKQSLSKRNNAVMVLTLKSATIDGRCTLKDVTINKLDASNLNVKGLTTLDTMNITNEVNLQNSNIQILQINHVTWPYDNKNINIERLAFHELRSNSDIDEYIDLLNKSHYNRNNYEQLIGYLERISLKEEADRVFRVMKPREAEKYAWWNPYKWLYLSYGWITGYGRDYSRIILGITIFLGFGALCFNPKYLVGKHSFAKVKNKFLLRLLISADFFLPNLDEMMNTILPKKIIMNLPQKLTEFIKITSIAMRLEEYWQPHHQPPEGIIKKYIIIHKMVGLISTLVIIVILLIQIIQKFLFS